MFIFTNVLTFRNITNAMRTFLLSLSDFPKRRYDFFFQTFLCPIAQHSFFLQIHSQLHRFWSKILCIYKRFSLRGHFLLSLPNFFRRRNEFSFQTLLCLVLLIAYHNFSTNSFTIASFLKQNSLYIQKVLTTRTFSPLSSQFFSGGETSFLSRHFFVLFS